MNLQNMRFALLNVLSYIYIVATSQKSNDNFKPSPRIYYTKPFPKGSVILSQSAVGSSDVGSDVTFTIPLRHTSIEDCHNSTKKSSKPNFRSSVSLVSSTNTLKGTDSLHQQTYSSGSAAINTSDVPSVRPRYKARSSRRISDLSFPYEYWKPNSKTTYQTSITAYKDKPDYDYYYGSPVSFKNESDPKTWNIPPINVPQDLIGEVKEGTTVNPTMDIAAYPSSIFPQYGRHPGATEPPPLYFPDRFGNKIQKTHSKFIERPSRKKFASAPKFSANSHNSLIPLYPVSHTSTRNDLKVSSSRMPSNKIEVISTDRNHDRPPHVFYPIQDTSGLQVSILQKNNTYATYSGHDLRNPSIRPQLKHETKTLIPSVQKSKHPGKPKIILKNDPYLSNYDPLDFSRYEFQKEINPTISRKTYNENLVDIIRGKIEKNKINKIFEDKNRYKGRFPQVRYPVRDVALENQKYDIIDSSGTHYKQMNATNLVAYPSNFISFMKDEKGHKNQYIKTSSSSQDDTRYPKPMSREAYNPLSSRPSHRRPHPFFYHMKNPYHHNQRPFHKIPPRKESPTHSRERGQLLSNRPGNTVYDSPYAGPKPYKLPSKFHFREESDDFNSVFIEHDGEYGKHSVSYVPRPNKPITSGSGTSSGSNYLRHDQHISSRPGPSNRPHHLSSPSHLSEETKSHFLQPSRPLPMDGSHNPSSHGPLHEDHYDNSLIAKLKGLWNAGFRRKQKPAPNAYPNSSKDSKHFLYYYFNKGEKKEPMEEKTLLERIASIQDSPVTTFIPGGMAALGLGLAYYYFNYVWYPTPVVTARLSNLLLSYADNDTLADRQNELEKIVEVFSGLESKYFTNVINSASCRNRLVCQLHQDVPTLWEVTQIISPLISSHLEMESYDAKALKNYMTTAQQGVEGRASCRDIFDSCTLPYFPLKSLIDSIFQGTTKTETEYGESRIL